MQIDLPQFAAIEDIIFRVALDRFGAQIRSAKNLAPAIMELSDFYNAPAHERRACPDSKYHQAARMMFFTLADMPKAYVMAAEADTLRGLPRKPKLKVLDLGVGYGAQSLGLFSYLFRDGHASRIQLDAVDKDADGLEAFEQVLELAQYTQLLGEIVLNSWRMDLNQGFLPRDRYDIIMIGSTLCELQPAAQYPLLTNLLAALSDSGVLCVLEPALKSTARNLHQLRDTLLSEQGGRVLSPCTRQTNCPCLDNDRDWCHESRQIVLPPRARQLAVSTGLRMHDVKWSYMTVMRSQNDNEKYADAWRIVSDLMKLKGKQEIFVCGNSGRLRAILQKRDKSAANKSFKKLRRGQLARIAHTRIKDDVLELCRESAVAIEEPIQQILS